MTSIASTKEASRSNWALAVFSAFAGMTLAACDNGPDFEVHVVWTDSRSPQTVTHNGQIVEANAVGARSLQVKFDDFDEGRSHGIQLQVELAGGAQVETILPVGSCLWNCADACTLTSITEEDFVAAVGTDGLVSVERASCRNEAGDNASWIARIVNGEQE